MNVVLVLRANRERRTKEPRVVVVDSTRVRGALARGVLVCSGSDLRLLLAQGFRNETETAAQTERQCLS